MSTPPRIAVVDYGAGNLKSVAKALLRSGLAPEVTADPASVRAAQAVVLPGVGAFADAVANLREAGLDGGIFALWSDPESERPLEDALSGAARFGSFLRETPGMSLVLNARDLAAAERAGDVAVVGVAAQPSQ